jgi:hypothetical protein
MKSVAHMGYGPVEEYLFVGLAVNIMHMAMKLGLWIFGCARDEIPCR